MPANKTTATVLTIAALTGLGGTALWSGSHHPAPAAGTAAVVAPAVTPVAAAAGARAAAAQQDDVYERDDGPREHAHDHDHAAHREDAELWAAQDD